MAGYYARKIVNNIISLFIFVTALFFIAQVMIPHDFTAQFVLMMNRVEREALREELGLNLPLWQQYLYWLGKLLRGDLGISFTGSPISEMLKSVIPPTLLIFLLGTVVAFLIGLWLGKLTAWKGPGLLSGAATFGAVALYTSFPPWLAFLMIYFFVRKFALFPPILRKKPLDVLTRQSMAIGGVSVYQVINRMLIALLLIVLVLWGVSKLVEKRRRKSVHPLLFVGLVLVLWVVSWYGMNLEEVVFEIVKMAFIPMVTYVLLSLGETMMITQTSMQDTMREEYVVTARAKGLSDSVVRDKHAVRNAIIPVLSRLVVSLPYLLTGIVIIENAVQWPGMGSLLFLSLYKQDMPVVMALLLIVGVISMIARFALDVISLVLDPRLRDRTFLIRQEQKALTRRV